MNKEYVEGFRAGYEVAMKTAQEAVQHMKDHEAVLPRPCDGPLYAKWTPQDYYYKLCEETKEVWDALEKWAKAGCVQEAKQEVGEELTDVIIISTSFLNALGFDYAARQKLMREKNESNGKRDGGKRFAQPQSVTLETEKAKTKAPEKVKHPAYYKRGIECIDYINSHNFNFCLGNAIKYITRAGYKTDDPREDLRKAIQYLEFELERIEKEGGKNA